MNTTTISVWIKKQPWTAICSGWCLPLLAGYFFRQGSVPEAEALLAQKTTESRRLKGNVTNSISLKDHVAALEEANRKVEQRLVQATDLAKNQQYFYKIEAETGVKLTDLRPGGSASTAAAVHAAAHARTQRGEWRGMGRSRGSCPQHSRQGEWRDTP